MLQDGNRVPVDLPPGLSDEELLLVEMVDAVAAERIAPACREADVCAQLDVSVPKVLAEQGLLYAGSAEAAGSGTYPLLGLLVIERLARVGAAAAALVATTHDAAAAYEGGARGALSTNAVLTLAAGGRGGMIAVRDGSGWRLQGHLARVEMPAGVETIVVLAGTEDGSDGAFELDRDAGGASWTEERSTGLRGLPVYSGELESCLVPDAHRAGGMIGARTARAHRAASSAALGVGIAAGAHIVASAYADERRQFGRRLREFPAVQGMLLDIEVSVASAAALLWAAARALENVEPSTESTCLRAASVASRTALSATRSAVQVHGGYGYIREYVVERYMRDAISAAARVGGSDPVRLDPQDS
jgi:alkylation response protein AidB-like acyl-CoA dehydrogenase